MYVMKWTKNNETLDAFYAKQRASFTEHSCSLGVYVPFVSPFSQPFYI